MIQDVNAVTIRKISIT